MTPVIACLGAGRMGRGIAIAFAFAGHAVRLIDFKPREADAFATLVSDVEQEIQATLSSLIAFGMMAEHNRAEIAARITVFANHQAASGVAGAAVIFEGIPEVVALKRDAFARISKLADPQTIIASTTSTILVDDLSDAVENPARFLNAHWLNPAYLIPLVELSPGRATSPEIVTQMREMLESIGKVPVVCAATPGYIVPRIQVVAMNEAARMVEEGVASAEDIDRAVRYGFGLRYAVLGLLEFIDWGGGDILYYASRYLTTALGSDRYTAPDIVQRNMQAGRLGMRSGAGFLDYAAIDVDAFRQDRLKAFVTLLQTFGLTRPPVTGSGSATDANNAPVPAPRPGPPNRPTTP